ncbi:hypothetical protein BDL97_08G115000 [Sphagnum fallax]|nr:hypothetical protein BDL97_08G115000 [Sphagnum fallax]KAH8955058.1 hypothetical protein BDL97_08G115000 [Sphagnum fallax]KAH8955059.1 hypothetical protein BDL97_08G115000 [Sphagnum fallax]
MMSMLPWRRIPGCYSRWLICGFHFGVLFRHCSRVFFKWEMMSYAGSTCEVKQPWIT